NVALGFSPASSGFLPRAAATAPSPPRSGSSLDFLFRDTISQKSKLDPLPTAEVARRNPTAPGSWSSTNSPFPDQSAMAPEGGNRGFQQPCRIILEIRFIRRLLCRQQLLPRACCPRRRAHDQRRAKHARRPSRPLPQISLCHG